MSKYVKGPWILDDGSHDDLVDAEYHFIDAGSGCIATDDPGFGIAGCMSIHDARLMAAAPDLLEALQAITDQLECIGDTRPHKDGQFIEAARAAISKALGGQP